jgi:hypothetical protein
VLRRRGGSLSSCFLPSKVSLLLALDRELWLGFCGEMGF